MTYSPGDLLIVRKSCFLQDFQRGSYVVVYGGELLLLLSMRTAVYKHWLVMYNGRVLRMRRDLPGRNIEKIS